MGPGGSVFGSNMVLFGANRSISFGGGEGGSGGAKRRSFFATPEELMLEEEYYDEQLLPEKKRRLTPDQVELLERSFEEENKLEPDRKSELAKKLGLQQRQIAVWFQNRRARWKNKQLERDFDHLKALYDALLADHDSLILNHHSLASDNQCLRSQVVSLTEKLKMVAPPEQPTHTPILITTLPPTNLKADDRLSADSAVVVDSGETYNQEGYQVMTCGYVMNSEDDSSENGGNCFATATLGGNSTLLGAPVEEEEAAAAAASGTGYWGWSTYGV